MNPQRLVDARKAKNLSQREVGEALGVPNKERAKAKISQYERGVLTPPYNVASQIAAILDVPTCYFYIDDDSFAAQVLLLYKKNFCQGNGFENELITTLTAKTREYEKAFEHFKETMESIKSAHEGKQKT
ncbi:transcriptional regulator [Xenorhabdus mauleonii]|uniref:Transcriptional regulator n=1 Tax=Xenorhabdus mauleonii TaxID=351675 RepID=A0A1I3SGS0_9GAMM|nr:helix-turn-helix transcriptional regulator [Xenorhabdus mauleonii]PHM39152.1 transcriptional regulator [Xenorhabdus mauleonii]SFJ56919.1 Transcriptional regulator, contains XRE-family HTH domain [Xenorhabdus mauleonii]